MPEKLVEEKVEKVVTDDMMESISALIDEFDKISSQCPVSPEDVVALLFRAYEEGFYGSMGAREDVVLTMLKEWTEARYKDLQDLETKSKEKEKKPKS